MMKERTRRILSLVYLAAWLSVVAYGFATYLMFAADRFSQWITGVHISVFEDGIFNPVILVKAERSGEYMKIVLWRTYAYPYMREMELRVILVTLSGDKILLFSKLSPATGQLVTQEFHIAGIESERGRVLQANITVLMEGKRVLERVVSLED